MNWVAGVDGCKGGWFVVLRKVGSSEIRFVRVPLFKDILRIPEKPKLIAVDIPIGLLARAERGGRECDREARRLLRPRRTSSVFSPPVRAALRSSSYDEAKRLNRRSSPANVGISIQAYSIFDKLNEIDGLVTPELQKQVFEVHPEVCFFQMNGGQAMTFRKRKTEGKAERRAALATVGFRHLDRKINDLIGSGVGEDDILDACAACWTAERKLNAIAICVPRTPPVDSNGLRMEIWR